MKNLRNTLTLIIIVLSLNGYSQQTLYSRTTANTWSTTNGGADCSCFPTSVDTVEISHNWANSSFDPLLHPANIAHGTFFPVSSTNNPFKVIIRSGGIGYQTGTIPTGMVLQVDNGGFWAFNGSVTFNGTAANSIAIISNEGLVLVNGSFVNNIAINSLGEFCTTGTFTQTLGGTFNSIVDGNLSPYFTNTNHGGFSNCLGLSTLPVELISFDVKLIKSTVLIQWATGSEINNDYFEVQTSKNGVNWETIHVVKGAGNSTNVIYYVSYDSKIDNYDIKYYRLKQFDYDGKNETSQIRLINFKNEIFFEAYNGGDNLVIKATFSKTAVINVYDINGKSIRVKVMGGENVIYIPTKLLSGGVYFITASIDGGYYSRKVLSKF